ncbi:MAG TPA: FAD-dependent thymidylate synthase [Edaphobacter sp.]|uniref:FAD-dependent thymidylate synthase n=1 Tax=Edaphobacter sp. TaxID=1934404 RepID=UPI002BEC72A9|nr:FAD-dependent thymidylate synthase [Edaphobacter sp.]HUZ97370.1 FAD-dependent thymidylate synthase [Edaphobacter sp.]
MHIVTPYAKIVNFMGLPPDKRGEAFETWRPFGIQAVRFIEETGRKCYRSEGTGTDESYTQFLSQHALASRHTSMLRFSQVVVDFMIDRGVAQEVTRHGATMDYQHESQRYCNYSKGKFGSSVGFIKPRGLTASQDVTWSSGMLSAEAHYFDLLTDGCKPQIAADVLPRATASLLSVVANLQGWRHFLLTRSTKQCHPKLLNTTVDDLLLDENGNVIPGDAFADQTAHLQPSLLTQFKAVFPLIFDDIEPYGDFVENMKKAR